MPTTPNRPARKRTPSSSNNNQNKSKRKDISKAASNVRVFSSDLPDLQELIRSTNELTFSLVITETAHDLLSLNIPPVHFLQRVDRNYTPEERVAIAQSMLLQLQSNDPPPPPGPDRPQGVQKLIRRARQGAFTLTTNPALAKILGYPPNSRFYFRVNREAISIETHQRIRRQYEAQRREEAQRIGSNSNRAHNQSRNGGAGNRVDGHGNVSLFSIVSDSEGRVGSFWLTMQPGILLHILIHRIQASSNINLPVSNSALPNGHPSQSNPSSSNRRKRVVKPRRYTSSGRLISREQEKDDDRRQRYRALRQRYADLDSSTPNSDSLS